MHRRYSEKNSEGIQKEFTEIVQKEFTERIQKDFRIYSKCIPRRLFQKNLQQVLKKNWGRNGNEFTEGIQK